MQQMEGVNAVNNVHGVHGIGECMAEAMQVNRVLAKAAGRVERRQVQKN
jgi:hypothetical protein